MLIDPFTIIAQVVNFAILVVALKYVLYNRIIDAMNKREAAIAQRLDDAEEREQQADAAKHEHREKIDELERRRGEFLEDARSAANDRRDELLESARHDIDEQRRRWKSALRRERDDLERELRTSTSQAALAVSRRVLRDVADADLQHRALELALDRLDGNGDLHELIQASDGSELTVNTAFDDDSARVLICDRLEASGLAGCDHLSFTTDPTLLLGIEVTSPTASLQWSANDYLDQLDDVVSDLLGELHDGSDRDGSDSDGSDRDGSDNDVADEPGDGRDSDDTGRRTDEQVHVDAG